MKKYITTIIPEHEEETEIVICDICKQEIKDGGISNVNIERYDDYGDEKVVIDKIDCCSDCFKDKIKPLIEKEFNVKF